MCNNGGKKPPQRGLTRKPGQRPAQGIALVVTHKSELVLINCAHWGIMGTR